MLSDSSTLDDLHRDIQARCFRTEIESVKAAIFLFHGRGGNAESIHQCLGRYILRDYVVIVVPEAYTNSWYPMRFNEDETANQPWLDSAISWIHSQVNSFVERGMDRSRIFFGGFSQGGCLALEYPLRYPNRYAGIFCLSGGVIGPEGSRKPLKDKALAGTPVFMGCADQDDWVPRGKFDESARLLSESGAKVQSQIYDGLGHDICEDEINQIKTMIEQALKN